LSKDDGACIVDCSVAAFDHMRPEDEAEVGRDSTLDDEAYNATGCEEDE
jgi:hypothetical protein